jgi:predicted transporter
MPMLLKAAGIGGSLLVVIALVIALLKTVISFIAFLTGAVKLLIMLVFIALIVGIGYMLLKSWNESRRKKD